MFFCFVLLLLFFLLTLKRILALCLYRKKNSAKSSQKSLPWAPTNTFAEEYIQFRKWATPAGIYLLKLNNRNTRTRCEMCSKLTLKIPERRHWRRSGIFIVNLEHISHLALVFLSLNMNMWLPGGMPLGISERLLTRSFI